MERPFGHTVTLQFSLAQSWLRLGPVWAVIAGALATGSLGWRVEDIVRLVTVWILVDPLLGTIWSLWVDQQSDEASTAPLQPAPSQQGFMLPYTQPGSRAERFVLGVRSYQDEWQSGYWPVSRERWVTLGVPIFLALLIAFFLHPIIFWLTLLGIGCIFISGISSVSTNALSVHKAWLQATVQFLLPWGIGTLAWGSLTSLGLTIGFCYWLSYIGGLGVFSGRQNAEYLLLGGQLIAVGVMVASGFILGSLLICLTLFIQWRLYQQSDQLLRTIQYFLIGSVLLAGFALGI
ncbi:MAG: hypothetical protein AAF485_10085 [Chloroflexota bacterium]